MNGYQTKAYPSFNRTNDNFTLAVPRFMHEKNKINFALHCAKDLRELSKTEANPQLKHLLMISCLLLTKKALI